jgi:hypothetical protein
LDSFSRTLGGDQNLRLRGAKAAQIPQMTVSAPGRRSMRADIVFVTRDGRVNTPDMLPSLDDALRDRGFAFDYQVVDLGRLPKATRPGHRIPDANGVYRNRDLFGRPQPTPPYPELRTRVRGEAGDHS